MLNIIYITSGIALLSGLLFAWSSKRGFRFTELFSATICFISILITFVLSIKFF